MTGDPAQDSFREKKYQQGIEAVKEDIVKMVGKRPEASPKIIQVKGKPSEGFPVSGFQVGQHPIEVGKGQGPDVGIVEDDLLVVPVQETIPKGGKIKEKGQKNWRTRPEPVPI
jgi:hypothetical protein